MMPFVDVAALDDLWDGEMRGYQVAGTKVLLVRMGDDAFAYEDRCAHLGVKLSEGTLENCVITCGAHHYQYDASTGVGVNPRNVRLRTFPVRLEQGRVLVDVPDVSARGSR